MSSSASTGSTLVHAEDEKDYALIPLTQALINWADEVVFVSQDVYNHLDSDEERELNLVNGRVTILNIPDDYEWGDSDLIAECTRQYNPAESK